MNRVKHDGGNSLSVLWWQDVSAAPKWPKINNYSFKVWVEGEMSLATIGIYFQVKWLCTCFGSLSAPAPIGIYLWWKHDPRLDALMFASLKSTSCSKGTWTSLSWLWVWERYQTFNDEVKITTVTSSLASVVHDTTHQLNRAIQRRNYRDKVKSSASLKRYIYRESFSGSSCHV